jgi:hypothetical protein
MCMPMDDSLSIVLLCSIFGAVAAYVGVRKATNREVDHLYNAARLQSPFGGAAQKRKLEHVDARFRYHMNKVQFISTLVGAAAGAALGYVAVLVDPPM